MSDGDDLPEPTPEPSDELGGKPGKWEIKAPSGKVEHEEKADGKDHKVGWGDRAPKPEDTSKPKEPSKPKIELAVKPIYQKQYADLVWKTTQDALRQPMRGDTPSHRLKRSGPRTSQAKKPRSRSLKPRPRHGRPAQAI